MSKYLVVMKSGIKVELADLDEVESFLRHAYGNDIPPEVKLYALDELDIATVLA